MSNQLQITGAAKVRGLEGVLTGTSGVVGALGINVANGIPKLDSNGKILVSQLPSSVMEYKGTWNAATNTPTLVNGTGDTGDVYLCSVAGTVNFGAGPITFAVGDQVIYSGSIWQKASGATGTVTSVSMTVPTGLSVTGSPITTSGTLAVTLSSGYTIPTTSFLQGLVPYTGATQSVDLGSYDLNARGIKINGTGGLGHADFKHQSGTPTGSASSSTLYADTNGDIAWLNDHSYTMTLIGSGNTANRSYTFPNASGTIALTSDLTGGTVTSVGLSSATSGVTIGSSPITTSGTITLAIATASGSQQGLLSSTDWNTFNNKQAALSGIGFVKISGTTISYDNNSYLPLTGGTLYGSLTTTSEIISLNSIVLSETGTLTNYSGNTNFTGTTNGLKFKFGGGLTGAIAFDTFGLIFTNHFGYTTYFQNTVSSNLTLTLPSTTGTLALTSDIPSLTNYATLNTVQTFTAQKTFNADVFLNYGATIINADLGFQNSGFELGLNATTLTANRAVYLQDKAGTIALLSNIPSLSGYVQGSGTSSYHAKFTAGSTIGNSMVTDDGTTLQSIGATRSNLYLKAASNSYYSQLAFTNGTNGSFGGISYNNSGQYMQFETNSSEWARLNSNGNFLIGTTSDNGSKLQVSGAATFSSSVTNSGLIFNTNDSVFSTAGSITKHATVGLVIRGVTASVFDYALYSAGGTALMTNPTGTNNINFNSGQVWFNGGNVGIGTSSPLAKLNVNGSMAQLGAQTQQTSGTEVFYVGQNSAVVPDDANCIALVVNHAAANSSPAIKLGYQFRTNDNAGGNLYGDAIKVTKNAGDNSTYTTFSTNSTIGAGTERMRITSGGQVIIGSTASLYPSVKLSIKQTSANIPAEIWSNYSGDSGSAAVMLIKYDNSSSSSQVFQRFVIDNGNTACGQINGNGASQVAFGSWSDSRLKNNIENLPSQLSNIMALRPVEFDYKNGSGHQIGFIAQEMQEVYPDAVAEDTDGFLTITGWSKTEARLVKAIQELSAQIEELEAKVTALENKI